MAKDPYPFYLNDVDDEAEEAMLLTQPPFAHPLGPDLSFTSGQSGGDSIEFLFPNPALDTILLGYDWGWTPFITYLRTCFQWGGFPGLRAYPQAVEAARDELAFLTKDLLPISP
jgi:hypothetical protein